jgi:hypothetical protein
MDVMCLLVRWCSSVLYRTHIASSSQITWKLISIERYEIISA